MPDSCDSSGPRLFDHTLIAPQTVKTRVLLAACPLTVTVPQLNPRTLPLRYRNTFRPQPGRKFDWARERYLSNLWTCQSGRRRPVDQIASDVAGRSTLAHVAWRWSPLCHFCPERLAPPKAGARSSLMRLPPWEIGVPTLLSWQSRRHGPPWEERSNDRIRPEHARL